MEHTPTRCRAIVPLALSALAIANQIAILFAFDGDLAFKATVLDFLMIAAGATAGASALLAAHRHPPGRGRLTWLLLGIGLLCWALGDAYWTWHQLATGKQPGVPSWADLGYLAFCPFALAGMALRPIDRPRDVSRGLLLLDATIVLSALFALSWWLVLGDLVARSAADPLGLAIAVSYPLGDVAMIFCVVMLVLRDARTRFPALLLIAGWTTISIADSIYVALTAANGYYTGHPVDTLWFAGLVVVGAAAWVDEPMATQESTAPDIGHPWRFAAPAGLVALAAGTAWVVPMIRTGTPPRPDEVALVVASVSLLLRFAVGYRDTAMAHRLEREHRRLAQQLALYDPLTQAANRRAFEAAATEMIDHSREHGDAFGLLFIDADRFKEYNDAYGHAAGDAALFELAETLRRDAEPGDIVARIGGDEFAVLVAHANAPRFEDRVARLRKTLWTHPGVRASVGGALWTPEMADSRTLMEAADRALYAAKKSAGYEASVLPLPTHGARRSLRDRGSAA